MKALVLGASGFIGSHIAQAACQRGWDLRGLRREPSRHGAVGEAPIEWITGDLDSPKELAPHFHGIDVVFHAAGYYPSHSKDVAAQVARSVQQTANVLALMREAKVRRLIYTSSFTTMVTPGMEQQGEVDEQSQYRAGMLARSAYYECKIAMEQVLLRAVDEGFEIKILNPTMVLGPGDGTQGTGAVFLALVRGRGYAWVDAKMNVVDVRDVAQGHLNAIGAGRSGERFLLAGHNLTLRQFMDRVAQQNGVRKPALKIPLALVDMLVGLEDRVPGVNVSANHLRALRFLPYFTNKKARQVLGLEFYAIDDTIRDAVHSYKDRGYL